MGILVCKKIILYHPEEHVSFYCKVVPDKEVARQAYLMLDHVSRDGVLSGVKDVDRWHFIVVAATACGNHEEGKTVGFRTKRKINKSRRQSLHHFVLIPTVLSLSVLW